MKTRSNIIVLVLFLAAGLVQAQETGALRKYSVGVKLAHLYDLPSYRFDSDRSTDLKGLNGEYTSFDLGVDLYGEIQLTPLIGFQGGLRFGGTTGANEVEYYDNNFQEAYADMILILSNLDKDRPGGLPLNYYAKLGLGAGGFTAERYLVSDNSLNTRFSDGFLEGRVGAGVQYEYNSYLRFDFEVAYNVAFNDGFDGYNYGTGSDPYLSTGVGVAYTFGNREDKPMYSVNLFDAAYTGAPSPEEAADAQALADSLNHQLEKMSGKIANLNRELEKHAQLMDEQGRMLSQQGQVLEHHKLKMGEQEQLIAELRAAAAKPEEEEPVTFWEQEERQVQVYFEFDSHVLTPETRDILTKALNEVDDTITLIGFASKVGHPIYNEGLKKRRVKAVKSYLTNELGITVNAIIEEVAGDVEDLKENNYLNRKVLVKY